MDKWLLNRIISNPTRQAEPDFAFRATINWMSALSILVQSELFRDDRIKGLYSRVQRRKPDKEADTIVFENMIMAFHNHASIVRFNKDIFCPYDICRSAIISWYYSIYFTCSAMIAGQSGSKQETHAGTAKVWQSEIVNKNLVLSPFSLNLSNILNDTIEREISSYDNQNNYSLNTHRQPQNEEEAWSALIAYLRGTAKYEQDKLKEKIKDRDLKKLGLENFRTTQAKEIRDRNFAKKVLIF